MLRLVKAKFSCFCAFFSKLVIYCVVILTLFAVVLADTQHCLLREFVNEE